MCHYLMQETKIFQPGDRQLDVQLIYIYKKNNSSQKDNADSSTMALCVYLHSKYLKDVVSTLSPSSSMNTY